MYGLLRILHLSIKDICTNVDKPYVDFSIQIWYIVISAQPLPETITSVKQFLLHWPN